MQKLDDDFIKAGGEWKKIAIETLFEKIPTKKLPYKARDLKNKHDEVYCLPALTAGVENQGLAYYVPVENATILKNCISVSANGANTGVMYYQSKEFTVLQDAYAIRFKEKELSELAYLYFVGVLQKAIRYRYNWSNKAGWERIKSVEITVPYVKNELAFSYMETYIKTLEAERIETLEAYLTVTGLKDYHLTEKDEKILDKFVKLSDTKSRVE
ncbi:restriction endonuclease subunit S [Streptococcus cuniculipharyngis]